MSHQLYLRQRTVFDVNIRTPTFSSVASPKIAMAANDTALL